MENKTIATRAHFFRNFFETLKDFSAEIAGVFSISKKTVRGGKLMATDNIIETSTETATTAKGKKSAKARTRGAKKASAGARNAGSAAPVQQTTPDPDVRFQMIREAAYHIAERNGFQPGQEEAYWLEAERQIDGSIIS